MAELRALSGREASIFACVTDTVVAPADGLPPVRDTDAVRFFDERLLDWVATALGQPVAQRIGA